MTRAPAAPPAGRPRIEPGWAPDRPKNGTLLVRTYVWQDAEAWEGIGLLRDGDREAGRFLALDWDGAIHTSTAKAVMMAFREVARNSSPWVPLSGLRMRQEAPGERPRFYVASYLASSGPLRPHLAAAENGA